MNTIIGLVMGLSIMFNGLTTNVKTHEVTTITFPQNGTRTVITETTDERYVEEYKFNYRTNEWELVEKA